MILITNFTCASVGIFFSCFYFLGNYCSLPKKAFCMFHSPYLRVAQERIFCRFSLSISCGTNHIAFFEVHCRICCLISESATNVSEVFLRNIQLLLTLRKNNKQVLEFHGDVITKFCEIPPGLFYIFPCQRRAILDTCSPNH